MFFLNKIFSRQRKFQIILVWTCLLVGFEAQCKDPTLQIPQKYQNFTLPRPAGFSPLTKDEIKIDPSRVDKVLKQEPPGMSRSDLKLKAEKLLNPTDFDKFWSSCAPMVNWELPDRNYKNFRFLWTNAALLYLFTGNKKVGRYIHDYMMESANFDAWFWIGRTNYAAKKWATLQTRYKIRDYIYVLSLARDTFSPEELKLLNDRLYTWGHQTSLNWIRKCPYNNNWVAVVGGGLLMSSIYFNDEDAKNIAIERLKHYINSTIEDDGSYGEQIHYFHYGLGSMMELYKMLDTDKQKELFGDSTLRHSADWAVYHYLFKKIYPGQRYFFKVDFGDNNYFEGPRTGFYDFLYSLYQSSSAGFINDHIAGKNVDGSKLDLPLFRMFENGNTFIRSGWDPDASVFAVHLNKKCKLNTHQRPESGNFFLGAYGLAIVIPSGNTNQYFDPIYKEEIKTSVANTILIDHEDQIRPGKTTGSKYLMGRAGKNADVAILDLQPAYKIWMKRLERYIIYLKNQQCFVILDRAESDDGKKHVYESRIHLNNIRHDAKLTPYGDKLRYTHPLAEMMLVTGCDTVNVNRIGKSFVCSELYNKFDKQQHKEKEKGNAIELIYGNPEPLVNSMIFAVLSPFKPGKFKEIPVSYENNVMTVGKDSIKLLSNGVSVTADGITEDFVYPEKKKVNIMQNPGAEEPADGKLIKGWGLYRTKSSNVELGLDSTHPHSGKNAVSMTFQSSSELTGILLGQSNGYTGEKALKVKPGETLTYSFWWRGNVENCQVRLIYWKSDEAAKADRIFGPTIKNVRPGMEWQQIRERCVIPPDVKRFAIQVLIIKAKKGQFVSVDDVVVESSSN